MEEEFKNITAEYMRNKSSINTDGELNRLLGLISQSYNNYIYLDDYDINHYNPEIKSELKKRGFVIEVGGRYNEVNTRISW
jgi:hypothetical protein